MFLARQTEIFSKLTSYMASGASSLCLTDLSASVFLLVLVFLSLSLCEYAIRCSAHMRCSKRDYSMLL